MTIEAPAAGALTFLGAGAISMASSIDPSLAVVIGGVMTTIVLQIMAYLREGRNHRWAREKADFERKEREAHAIRAKAGRAATRRGLQAIVGKIDENTVISVKAAETAAAAFEVGNHVNEKLVAIGEARVRHKPDRQSDHIQAVVEDTNAVVHRMAPDAEKL